MDSRKGVVGRREEAVDLVLRQVLAKVARRGMGDFHELVVAEVQVVLRQADPEGHNGIWIEAAATLPAAVGGRLPGGGRASRLVNDVLARRQARHGRCQRGQPGRKGHNHSRTLSHLGRRPYKTCVSISPRLGPKRASTYLFKSRTIN